MKYPKWNGIPLVVNITMENLFCCGQDNDTEMCIEKKKYFSLDNTC